MLTFQSLANRQDRLDLLEKYDPQNSTWIVADLDHKNFIQNHLLEKFGWLAEDSCLRATELWSKFAKQTDMPIRLVSPMFMEAHVARWLGRQQGAKTLLAYVEAFLPILRNEAAQEHLQDWLREHPESILRWGRWFQEACRFWNDIQADGQLMAKWLPGFLSGENRSFAWPRSLVVDLGPDLTSIEMELFKDLSTHVDVHIVHPGRQWMEKYPKLFWPYVRELETESNAVQEITAQPATPPKHWTCARTSTQLSEIKFVTEKTREWLDAGESADQIVIFAADPEAHWPILSAYFDTEGIAVAKARVSLAHSFPAVSAWLSRIRLLADPVSSEDHEQNLFRLGALNPPSYEKFRSVLSNIYEDSDLRRFFNDELKAPQRLNHKGVLTRDQFIRLSLQEWDFAADTLVLQRILNVLLLECAYDMKISVPDWLRYLEALVARTEIKVTEQDASGVGIRRMSSMYMNEESHAIVLSLSESSLAESKNINLTQSEVMKIQNDLGYALNRPEPGRLQFLVEWAFADIGEDVVLAYSETDFLGEPQAPSIFWSEMAIQSGGGHHIQTFGSRWDQIQESSQSALAESVGAMPDAVMQRMAEDMGQPSAMNIRGGADVSVSASQLESYSECPFKFLSSKLFKLRTEPELDLDLDRLRRGSLLHKTLELLLEKPLKVLSDSELGAIVDEARFAIGLPVDQVFWPNQKFQYVQSLKRFIDFELSWRQQFPVTETVGRELAFEGQVMGHLMRGKIDRVDRNGKGEYIVIDYKSSGSDLKSYTSWLENDDYQLLIYARAIENGWTSLPKGPVVGAFYFDLKNLERNFGFGVVEDGKTPDLFPPPGRKGYGISGEGLVRLNEEFDLKVRSLIENIDAGQFPAVPKDPDKSCAICDWRTLCRAPHLNL